MSWERVHAVLDYYDGPRLGVADFRGKPHAFRSVFDVVAQDWSPEYLLKPLTGDEFETVMKDWAIWLRWLSAYRSGSTSIETHPALPVDAVEHLELSERVATAMAIVSDSAITAAAHFRGNFTSGEMTVQWTTR
jgi:hypothetical protein